MRLLCAIAAFLALAGCAGRRAPVAADMDSEIVLTGELGAEEILAALPDWHHDLADADPDPGAALALAEVPMDLTVTVYFGSWCADSRRELTRLWRALDETGGVTPFALRYVGVDRSKSEPQELVEGTDLLYVPTFVVERDGVELGRIVEESPRGIEVDLLALLDGSASGLVTARTDLAAERE